MRIAERPCAGPVASMLVSFASLHDPFISDRVFGETTDSGSGTFIKRVCSQEEKRSLRSAERSFRSGLLRVRTRASGVAIAKIPQAVRGVFAMASRDTG